MSRVLNSITFGGTYKFHPKELGSGAQSTVYKAYNQIEGQPDRVYAVKQTSTEYIKGKDEKQNARRYRALVRELVLMEMIQSEHVIRIYEFIKTKRNYYMVQEFANGGTLQGLLNSHTRFPEPIAKKFIKQIISGMTALYQKRIMHRDLKLDNILVHFPNQSDELTKEQMELIDLRKEPFQVKIADLGYSRGLDEGERAKTQCGTPLLMAPETLSGKEYDHKVDVWALGVIFFQLLTGIFVFSASTLEELRHRVRKGQWQWPKGVKFSLQGLEFLNATFQYNPKLRMSWDEVSKHVYLKVDADSLIDLEILFQEDEQDPHFGGNSQQDNTQTNNKSNAIVINTRDPKYYDRLYQKAATQFMAAKQQEIDQCEDQQIELAQSCMASGLKSDLMISTSNLPQETLTVENEFLRVESDPYQANKESVASDQNNPNTTQVTNDTSIMSKVSNRDSSRASKKLASKTSIRQSMDTLEQKGGEKACCKESCLIF